MADLGLLAGLAQGLKEGVQGYATTKREQDELSLRKQMQQAQLVQQGLVQNPENGTLELNPAKQAEAEYQKQFYTPGSEMAQRQAALGNQLGQKFGLGQGLVTGQESAAEIEKGLLPTALKGEYGAMGRQIVADRMGQRTNAIQEIADQRLHNQIINRVANDKQLGQRVTQYQNLQNSLSNVANADRLTPQQIMEFQQSVRSNLGIRGQGGVGEREETYLKSLGLNGAAWKQFLTGEPAQISQNNAIVQHIKNLAGIEMQNIEKQMNSRLDTVSKGTSGFYNRRPDLKQDLTATIQSYKGQIAPQQQGEGLVQPGVQQSGGPPPNMSFQQFQAWKKQNAQ